MYGLHEPLFTGSFPHVCHFISCPAGSLFQPGGEVCRYRQGAYNETHAANGRTNGHVQPHGHPVRSIWRLCTGSKYRYLLYAMFTGTGVTPRMTQKHMWAEEKNDKSRGGTSGFSVKSFTRGEQTEPCHPG